MRESGYKTNNRRVTVNHEEKMFESLKVGHFFMEKVKSREKQRVKGIENQVRRPTSNLRTVNKT